jgi:AraC-like DNA-binding protein
MTNILLVVCSVLVGHIFYLALYLIVNHRQSGNHLLGIALILYATRVGKSVLTLAFPEEALWLSSIGLVCMAALGPLLYLYSIQLFSTENRITKSSFFHFIPAVLGCFCWNWNTLNPAYYLITLQMLTYVMVVSHHLYVNREIYHVDNIRWKWSIGVTIASWIIWVSFQLQILIYRPLQYLAVVCISVILVYTLSLWASRQNNLFASVSKKKSHKHPEEQKELGERIKKMMEEDEIFIDPSLSLSLLAKKLSTPPYIISKCVNSVFHKSFPELLICYRIEKSKQLLLSSMNNTYSVEGIAYESGFNTLSAFYKAFKRINGMTPAQFRKNAETSMKVA